MNKGRTFEGKHGAGSKYDMFSKQIHAEMNGATGCNAWNAKRPVSSDKKFSPNHFLLEPPLIFDNKILSLL